MSEYERLVKSEPHMPRSRFKLAIPFVGKDVPSVRRMGCSIVLG